jgi:hypothetical protein
MVDRPEYWVKSPPRRQAYQQLIDFCIDNATVACLIDRFDQNRKAQAARQRVIGLLGSHLVAEDLVTSWPGSGSDKPVGLWQLRADRDLADILKLLASGLDDWQSPNLPEDLHFYRAEGSILLGSVAHEEMAWMKLDKQEATSPALGLIELELRR